MNSVIIIIIFLLFCVAEPGPSAHARARAGSPSWRHRGSRDWAWSEARSSWKQGCKMSFVTTYRRASTQSRKGFFSFYPHHNLMWHSKPNYWNSTILNTTWTCSFIFSITWMCCVFLLDVLYVPNAVCLSGYSSTSAHRRARENQGRPIDSWNLGSVPSKEPDWCKCILIQLS